MATQLSHQVATQNHGDRLIGSRSDGHGKGIEMSAAAQSFRQLARYPTDTELLSRVLRVYLPHCRYLKSAEVETAPESAPSDQLTVFGEFEIGDSCYIDDTGHFNSVEFNICYNQLAYYLIAKSVKDGLLDVFRGWVLDDFWRLQLGDILITDFRSTFKRQMRGKKFSGAVSVVDVVRLEESERWRPLIVIRTSCRYWDEAGGHCRGEVKIAITNPV